MKDRETMKDYFAMTKQIEFNDDVPRLLNFKDHSRITIVVECNNRRFPAYLTPSKRNWKFKYFVGFDADSPPDAGFCDLNLEGNIIEINKPTHIKSCQKLLITICAEAPVQVLFYLSFVCNSNN